MKKILLMAAMALVGFSAQAQAAVQNLKWAHGYEVGEPFHLQAVVAAEKIKFETAGRVTVEVFPASKLGPENDYSKKMAAGEIDLAYIGMNSLSRDYAPLGIMGYPFLFSDTQHIQDFFRSPVFAELQTGYKSATKNSLLSAVYYGSRHVTSNKLISTPKDMVDLKLRVPDAPAYKLFAKSMGVNMTPMAFAKVYEALKTGEVEAQENPLTTILAKKFYEVQKNIVLTAHIHDSIGVVMGEKVARKLSEADLKIVENAILRETRWISASIVSAELLAEKNLRDLGITITRPDRQLFIDAAQKNISPSDLQALPGMFEKIRALSKNKFR